MGPSRIDLLAFWHLPGKWPVLEGGGPSRIPNLVTPPGPWLFPWRSRNAIPAPWNETCGRNGSLKHERRSFGICGPGCLQNILNFECTQKFGYETPVVSFREPLRRHVCGWLGLAGASRRESGPGWVSSRHDGLRAVRNQRS